VDRRTVREVSERQERKQQSGQYKGVDTEREFAVS
jgi:hypothetical protein